MCGAMTKDQAEKCQRVLRKLGVEARMLQMVAPGYMVVVEMKEHYWSMPEVCAVANFAMGLRWRDEEAEAVCESHAKGWVYVEEEGNGVENARHVGR